MDDSPQPADRPQGPHFSSAAAVEPLRLVLHPGGMVLELTRSDIIMGRHSEADVRLPLPDVSRRHCRFSYHGGTWQIIDLNSLNGVYVNDQPVQQANLKVGDRVRVGGFTFFVELPGPTAAGAAEENLASCLFKGRSGVRQILPGQRRAS
jgi:pSer/pThr/pTyr-binding forkhead associated (FHA) protein